MNTGETNNKSILRISIYIVLATIALLAAFFVAGISVASAEISLRESPNLTVEYGSEWKDPGADGIYIFPVVSLLSSDQEVTVYGEVDTHKLGEQTVTYAFDHLGSHAEETRTVTVVDTLGPEITLTTNPDYYTKPNEEYIEEGFSAFDLYDGDVTDTVTVTVSDDKIIYSATDSSGNTTTVERKIPYDDRVAPELVLNGGEEITWLIATPYKDSFTAVDDVDGDITDKVIVSGEVDIYAPGDYKLSYEVSDEYNNTTKAERTVHVIVNEDGNEHYVYLTFDDGPYKYTERLLDILDKYGAKATFFVTAWYGYPELIGEEFRRGHSVGVHTYHHKYDEIYSSDEAFWEDFEKVQDLIEEQTGQRTNIMRFPGGSSNGVSSKYNEGIMTRLAQQATEKGYAYFDWNVSSGDAGEFTDPEDIVEYTIAQLKNYKTAIVLFHDVKEYTVDAIEDILIFCLQNGYTILPLTENSPTAHHTIIN